MSLSRPYPSPASQNLLKTPPYRSRSTFQDAAGDSLANDLLSALLQGQKKPGDKASQQTSSIRSRTPQSTPSLPKTSSPFSKAQSDGQTTQMGRDFKGQKRRAPEPLHSPYSRRLKPNPRSPAQTVHSSNAVPTAEQYPDLPREIFEIPKQTLHNTLQGFATISSTTTSLGAGKTLCRVTCSIHKGRETVVTEAQAKTGVCLSSVFVSICS